MTGFNRSLWMALCTPRLPNCFKLPTKLLYFLFFPLNIHSMSACHEIHVNIISVGSRHGKCTLKHTRVRYVWRLKTWLTYIKAYACTLCLKARVHVMSEGSRHGKRTLSCNQINLQASSLCALCIDFLSLARAIARVWSHQDSCACPHDGPTKQSQLTLSLFWTLRSR